MFNTLAMGSMGADAFHAYMTGGARDDAALIGAIDVFGDVLANYVNANAASTDFSWTNAAGEVVAGPRGDVHARRLGEGLLRPARLEPRRRLRRHRRARRGRHVLVRRRPVFAAHGRAARGAGAGLPRHGRLDRGQVAFNKLKGSSPIRTDVPLNQLDPEGRARRSPTS